MKHVIILPIDLVQLVCNYRNKGTKREVRGRLQGIWKEGNREVIERLFGNGHDISAE